MTYSNFLEVPEWFHGAKDDVSVDVASYSVESDSEGSAESATSSPRSQVEDSSDLTRPWKWLTISTIRHAQVRTFTLTPSISCVLTPAGHRAWRTLRAIPLRSQTR